jgi:hypothetical protein
VFTALGQLLGLKVFTLFIKLATLTIWNQSHSIQNAKNYKKIDKLN